MPFVCCMFGRGPIDLESHQLAYSPRLGLSVIHASVSQHTGLLNCFLRFVTYHSFIVQKFDIFDLVLVVKKLKAEPTKH